MKTIKTIRSRTLILFSATLEYMYSLFLLIVVCMCVWQQFWATALGVNLPLKREAIKLRAQKTVEDAAGWERMNGQTASEKGEVFDG